METINNTTNPTTYCGLVLRSVRIAIEETNHEIVKNIDLTIAPGTIHALMGPNGSGKSTLALSLMGHPSYAIIAGTIMFNGVDITQLEPHKRAQLGIFLSFQTPYEMTGVPCFTFLRESYNACKPQVKPLSIEDFRKRVLECMRILSMSEEFLDRQVNVGASGGEKKRLEMLQLMLLEPELAILDEIDSGLDVDALVAVGNALAHCRTRNPNLSILMITHYQRLLQVVPPEHVHVMRDGVIVATGNSELAQHIDRMGYDGV